MADMQNTKWLILGGEPEAIGRVAEVYRMVFPAAHMCETTSTTAEMVKYVVNCFLAVKVSFANEIFGLCKALSLEYSEVLRLATMDSRLGMSHWCVPGPDGLPGFSGSCFPKDLNAILHLLGQLGMAAHTLRGAWDTNLAVRPQRDWEQLVGRAVAVPSPQQQASLALTL